MPSSTRFGLLPANVHFRLRADEGTRTPDPFITSSMIRRVLGFLGHVHVIQVRSGALRPGEFGTYFRTRSNAGAAFCGRSPHAPTPQLDLRVRVTGAMTRVRIVATVLPLLVMAASTALLSTPQESSAYPTLKLKLIATSVSPGLTDGTRWAAFEPSAGTTRVIDARTGRAVDRPNPSGCGGFEGGLLAVGGGELLYRCEVASCPHVFFGCPATSGAYWEARYVVEDIASAREYEISRLPFDPEGPQLHSIGSEWSSGEAVAYKYRDRFYVNWHTGQATKSVASGSDVIDLGDPGLTRALCRPLTRALSREGLDRQVEREPAYAPPFPVEEKGLEPVQLTLLRCGARREEDLPGSRNGAVWLQLGGAVVSWIAPGKNNSAAMYATRLDSHGAQWHGTIRLLLGPKYTSEPGAMHWYGWTLQHTATTVYQSDSAQGHQTIYAARLP